MGCSHEAIELMHKYLDDNLTQAEETGLRGYLEDCESCQQHFHELKRTITRIQSVEPIEAPAHFTNSVMEKLPKERKRVGYRRWFKAHPIITAAAIFLIFLFSGVFSAWNHDNQLVVSKQENLIIEGDTVIVPAGVTVSGDLVVKNGDLIIDGTVDGNVTLINGKLANSFINGEGMMASIGDVNGDFKQVDQLFEWIWYQLKNIFDSIFSFGNA